MKPAFDPSKPFEVAEKPPFDPSKPFESSEQPEEIPKPRPFRAFLQGAGQAYTLGYLPNIQAAAQKVTDPIYSVITGKDVEPQTYIEARDANIKTDQSLQKENPGSYLGGQVVGTIASPSPIKGGGLIKTIGKGLLESSLYNPGEKEGEVSGLQVGERLKQGLIGGGVGGALGGVGGLISKSAPKLKSASDYSTIKALGAQKGDFKRLSNKNEIQKVADFAKKEGLTGIGKTVEHSAEGSKRILKEVGPKIGALYKRVNQKVNDPQFLSSLKEDQAAALLSTELSPKQMGAEIFEDLSKEWSGKAGGKQVLSRVGQEIEQLQGLGDEADIEKLYTFRRSLDDLINFDKAVKDMPGAQKALAKMRDKIQSKVDTRIDVLDGIVGGDELKVLKDLNQRFSGASKVNKISGPAFMGEEAKMALGLPELIGGGAIATGAGAYGVATGDPQTMAESAAKGLLGAVAIKGARRLGPGLLSKGLEVGSRAAEKTGGLLDGEIINRVRRNSELEPAEYEDFDPTLDFTGDIKPRRRKVSDTNKKRKPSSD